MLALKGGGEDVFFAGIGGVNAANTSK